MAERITLCVVGVYDGSSRGHILREIASYGGDFNKRLYVFPPKAHFKEGFGASVEQRVKGVRKAFECVYPDEVDTWALLVTRDDGADWCGISQLIALIANE